MVKHFHPAGMMSPFSTNTHAIEVPTQHRIVFTSGQVGQREDGTIPDDFLEQAELVWQNLRTVLEAADMGLENLVHINTYLTRHEDVDSYLEMRAPYMAAGRPTATLVIVSGLADRRWLVEVEGYAVAETE